MPVVRVNGGFRWGKTGMIYRGRGAYQRALEQGRAIKAAQARRK